MTRPPPHQEKAGPPRIRPTTGSCLDTTSVVIDGTAVAAAGGGDDHGNGVDLDNKSVPLLVQ